MPCYHPRRVWRKLGVNPATGKRGISFLPGGDESFKIPCGQCIGCRLERSRQWAIRCIHEAQMHKQNCFVTLTYKDECLPDGGSLVVRDFQLFMKRLRKRFGRVRFFHCGEYGEELSRPHYHACLFGFDFPDRKLWSVRDGVPLYRSEELEKLWPFGFATVGDVTFESAAYVARYVTKKVTGNAAGNHYKGLKPEYVTMSRRPGIGAAWFEKFASDVYPGDTVVIRGGVKCRPPRFYDKLLERVDAGLLERLKFDRVVSSLNEDGTYKDDVRWDRLLVREEVKELNSNRLVRGYENGGS